MWYFSRSPFYNWFKTNELYICTLFRSLFNVPQNQVIGASFKISVIASAFVCIQISCYITKGNPNYCYLTGFFLLRNRKLEHYDTRIVILVIKCACVISLLFRILMHFIELRDKFVVQQSAECIKLFVCNYFWG